MISAPASTGIYTHGIFILGAGFSRAAGLPLGCELWKEVLRRALSMEGQGLAMFREDLDDYLAFKKQCDREDLTYESVEFEEFLGFLDIEHHLGLRGADTWSDDGNEAQVLIKTLIGQILTECTPPVNKIPDIYLNFARKLRPQDRIITFNYDILLERALEAAGVAYRLYPDRFLSVDPWGGGSIDSSHEEVVVLRCMDRLTGSIKVPFGGWKNKRARMAFPLTLPSIPCLTRPRNLR